MASELWFLICGLKSVRVKIISRKICLNYVDLEDMVEDGYIAHVNATGVALTRKEIRAQENKYFSSNQEATS